MASRILKVLDESHMYGESLARGSKAESLISELIVLFLQSSALDSFAYTRWFSKFIIGPMAVFLTLGHSSIL
jgi:hypothetical protein